MIAAPGRVLLSNFPLPSANTLYYFDVPKDTTHLTLKARNGSTIKLSFNDDPTYFTLGPRWGYYEQNIKFNGMIGFISSADNEVMEIICWYGTP